MKLCMFAKKLQEAIKKHNMSQRKFAALLHTTQANISRWTQGVSEPRIETFLKVCLYLDETPESMLGYGEIPDEVKREYKKESGAQ